MHVRHDVIVVGSGPAGAYAAYELGRRGVRTLLLEKFRLPRDKPCGGGLTAKVIDFLPFALDPVVERRIHRINLSWRLSQSTTFTSATPLVHMVRRPAFDQFLAAQAVHTGRVELIDECPVLGAEQDGGRIRVRTARGDFEAHFLIGADGARGVVARSFGLMQARHLMPATESELVVDPESAAQWQDCLGLDIGSLRGSYGWVFPKGDHLNVGVGAFTDESRVVQALKRYGQAHEARRIGGIRQRLNTAGFVLPLRTRGAAIQSDRVLLIGDAAGLVEAFTGEGIYWALRSARIAAECIAGDGMAGAGMAGNGMAGNGIAPDGMAARGFAPQDLAEEHPAGPQAAAAPASRTGYKGYAEQIDRQIMPDLYAARRWAGLYLLWPRSCYSLPRRSTRVWRAVERLLRGEHGFDALKGRMGHLGFLANLLPRRLP